MANLIRMPRSAWRRQPSGLVDVNRGNSLTDRLYSSVIPTAGKAFDPVRKLILSSNVGFAANSYGTVFSFNGSTQYIELQFSEGFYDRLVLDSEYSICALFRTSIATTTRQVILGDWNSSGQFNSSTLEFSAYQQPSGNVSSSRPDNGGPTFSGVAGATNVWYFATLAFTASESRMTIVNSDTGAVLLHAIAAARTGNGGVNAVVGRAGDADLLLYFAGQVGCFFGYRRALSQAESLELARNPWQLFAPAPSRFYLIPSTGTVTFKPYWARSRSLILGSGV